MRIHSAKDLGALVRTQRKTKGWTQIQLADQVGVRPLWISQFERGKITAQIGLVLRALRALDLTLSVGDSKNASSTATRIDLDEMILESSSVREESTSDTPKDRKNEPQ
jgi:HTH-type transcriptional regulator/antitoxin HipB